PYTTLFRSLIHQRDHDVTRPHLHEADMLALGLVLREFAQEPGHIRAQPDIRTLVAAIHAEHQRPGDESHTKGPHLLTGQVLRLAAGRSELRQQPLSAALDMLLHHRRQPFLFGPLSLPLGAARFLLHPALLPFLRCQVTLATPPPALLGVVDHRSDPDLPTLAALPH